MKFVTSSSTSSGICCGDASSSSSSTCSRNRAAAAPSGGPRRRAITSRLLLSIFSARQFSALYSSAASPARQAKNKQFWQTVGQENVETEKMAAREAILDRAQEISERLAEGAADEEIAALLRTASEKLRTASHTVFQHVSHVSHESKKKQEERLPHRHQDGSFDSAPDQWYVSSRAKLLEGEDESTIKKDRESRIQALEPLLEPEVDVLGDVLTQCREGREAAGDVIKRDLYRPRADGVKTGADAKEVARQLQDLGTEIRSQYMKMIMGFAHAIVQNFQDVGVGGNKGSSGGGDDVVDDPTPNLMKRPVPETPTGGEPEDGPQADEVGEDELFSFL